jgi:hypothetical protein
MVFIELHEMITEPDVEEALLDERSASILKNIANRERGMGWKFVEERSGLTETVPATFEKGTALRGEPLRHVLWLRRQGKAE